MFFKTIFLSILVVWVPDLAMAYDCYYEDNLVPGNQIVTDEDVVQSTWLAVDGEPYGRDTDKVLYLTYENGDIVTISHRYCQMYEFEATVMWVEKPDPNDWDGIAKRLAALFNEYSALKSNEKPIEPILSQHLFSLPLDSEAPVSEFISEIDIITSTNVEGMVTVTSYPNHLPGVKFMTTLYVGVGGLP